MTLSPRSRSLAVRADALAGELLVLMTPDRDGFDTVARYKQLVCRGLADDDAGMVLRGANLLTTVNKGITDHERAGDDPRIADAAAALGSAATDAARSLRADVGIPY